MNLHFQDKESAHNWSDTYGGSVHDNMHSRGWRGSSTNYTVHLSDHEDEDIDFDETIFLHGARVFDIKHGWGRVQGSAHGGQFQVIFDKGNWDKFYSTDTKELSFCDSVFSHDVKDRIRWI